MRRVLVVYGSRHRGTAGIAERIVQVLRAEGVEATGADAADRPDPREFDAFVIGSGVYMGSWLKEATEFVERNTSVLAAKPVWLFSSGPLPNPTVDARSKDLDPIEKALGPAEGPGSGGRKRIAALSAVIQPRDHRVFQGAYDPSDPPASFPERIVRLMPASKSILPTGDFREWDEIEGWAREIARELTGVAALA
jgi:menaquinone-dependent protoporphyrinogen oxidase